MCELPFGQPTRSRSYPEVEDRALKVGETLERLGAQVGFDTRPDFDLTHAMNNYSTFEFSHDGGMG